MRAIFHPRVQGTGLATFIPQTLLGACVDFSSVSSSNPKVYFSVVVFLKPNYCQYDSYECTITKKISLQNWNARF